MTAVLLPSPAPLNGGRHAAHKTHYKALLAPAWEWRPYAACLGIDPSMFVLDRNDPRAVADAKRICVGCPVREHCLEHATTNNEYGVWGATTDAERRIIRRQRKLRVPRESRPTLGPPDHHSEARHKWNQHYGLPRCNECAMASTAARKARHARQPIDVVTDKVCKSCRQRKPAEAFHKKKPNRDGLHEMCRACRSKHRKHTRRLYGVKM